MLRSTVSGRSQAAEGRALAPHRSGSLRRSPWEAQRKQLRLALIPTLLVLTVVTLLPYVFLFVVSLTSFDLARPETWMNFGRPARQYQLLIRDWRFSHSLFVQAELSAGGVGLSILIGLVGALLLMGPGKAAARLRLPFLIPMSLPPIAAAIIWKVLFTPNISPLNWLLGLAHLPQPAWLSSPTLAVVAVVVADVWQWFPFSMLSILAALQMTPRELTEAALVDGASALAVFRYILLPFITPVLVVVGLFRLIDSFKAFPLIYVMTEGGPGVATEPTNYYGYLQGFSYGLIGYSSAIGVVLLLITIGLSVFVMGASKRQAELA